MKKDILIIGTGGLAAALTSFFEDGDFPEYNLKGYLSTDDKGRSYWEKYDLEKPFLGLLQDYQVSSNEYFVISIGNVKVREQIILNIQEKNGKFISLIHPLAKIAKSAQIGNGNIIDPFCILGPNTVIGDFNILTSQSVISHDSIVGDNNFFATALLCGDIKVGNNNTFGIRCTIIPSIIIGNNNVIKAGMLIDKNIGNQETVFYKFKEKIIAIPKE